LKFINAQAFIRDSTVRQGSHGQGKTGKNLENDNIFSLQGKIVEFGKNGEIQGKIMEFENKSGNLKKNQGIFFRIIIYFIVEEMPRTMLLLKTHRLVIILHKTYRENDIIIREKSGK
jgi:hypothetical protein